MANHGVFTRVNPRTGQRERREATSPRHAIELKYYGWRRSGDTSAVDPEPTPSLDEPAPNIDAPVREDFSAPPAAEPEPAQQEAPAEGEALPKRRSRKSE